MAYRQPIKRKQTCLACIFVVCREGHLVHQLYFLKMTRKLLAILTSLKIETIDTNFRHQLVITFHWLCVKDMIACEVLGLFLGHEWTPLAQGYLVLDLSKNTKWTHHNGVEKCYHRDTSIQKHVASQGSHCGEDFHPSTPRRWHCSLFTPGWYIIQVHRSCVCGCMNTILSAVNSLQQNFSWSWHDSVTPGRWCGYVQRHSSPCRETSLYYDLSKLMQR